MATYSRIHASQAAVRHREIVETVEVFLRTTGADSVSLSDLCRVAGVCERTLRNAFQRVRGASPKRYIIRTRLNDAREALRGEAAATVTSVATEHGFYELGRFASQYKAAFGECPSATLRSHRLAA